MEELIGKLPPQIREIQGWEYRVLDVGGATESAAEEALSKLGTEGWECFAVTPAATKSRCFFKRRKMGLLRYLIMLKSLGLSPE